MYIGGGEGVIILMDKHAIIKLKLEGHSNRKLEKMININRKTIAKYWNEYKNQMKLLSSTGADNKEIQKKYVQNQSMILQIENLENIPLRWTNS